MPKKQYVRRGFGEAIEIIQLLVDHYRAGRITVTDDLASVTIERAQVFLAARQESADKWASSHAHER